jgi:hypothetical protein
MIRRFSVDKSQRRRSWWDQGRRGRKCSALVLAFAAIFRPRALLVAENFCLRQQLLVLQRRHPRPRLTNADRPFWILASDGLADGWQRLGWRAYWTWRSSRRARGGRPAIAGELQALIRRMSTENSLWGQKRIQAELARLGFKVSARTVAKYMRARDNRDPSPGWREFLKRHAPDIWACDFFCVRTVLFQTLHVFFVVRHAKRETLHAEVTRHPTADWATQQIVEYCAWDRARPRFSIHDRDSRYGASFDRRAASSHAFQITSTQRSR